MDNENQFNEMDIDDIQKEVFAENLRYYIELNQKQQIDVAKDLGINPTTLSMWCTGKSFPRSGKLQALADYFKIGKTDLIDPRINKPVDEEFSSVALNIGMNDERFKKIIIEYSRLPVSKKNCYVNFSKNLYSKRKGRVQRPAFSSFNPAFTNSCKIRKIL